MSDIESYLDKKFNTFKSELLADLSYRPTSEYSLSLQEALEHVAKGGKASFKFWRSDCRLVLRPTGFNKTCSLGHMELFTARPYHLTGWKIVDT